MAEREPQALVADVERLLEQVESLGEQARETATELVAALLDLYGTGLARIVEEVSARGGAELARALAEDELVSHLLLLHGLHPVALERRVRDALDEVRPYLESHGGDVELVAVQESVVHLRLRGSCSGCPSSTMTLKLAIENAIRKSAPEIEEVRAEPEPAGPAAGSGLLQIELVSPAASMAGSESPGGWVMAGGLRELAAGGVAIKEISGESILFAAVGGRFYAYHPACPECEDAFEGAGLDGAALICPGCGNRFDLLRAGRCLDAPRLHLRPVPLLVGEDGLVKVAVQVAV